MIRRGIARGELRDDVDMELMVDVMLGPLLYHVIATGGAFEELIELQPKILALQLQGLAPESARR